MEESGPMGQKSFVVPLVTKKLLVIGKFTPIVLVSQVKDYEF